MKIVAFSGAGGTGKSTVADFIGGPIPSPINELRQQFYGKDAKYGEFTRFADILEWQYRILFAQVALENFNRNTYLDSDYVIPVERSTIDYAAYMLAQTQRFSRTRANFVKIEEYVKWCVAYANESYDYLVYFPIGKFKPADSEGSAKERDEKSVARTDQFIRLLLEEVTIPVLHLEPVGIEARANAIWDFCMKDKPIK